MFSGLKFNGVFPNPATNETVIQFSLDKSEVVRVKISTLEEEIVYDNKVMRAAGQHNIKIILFQQKRHK